MTFVGASALCQFLSRRICLTSCVTDEVSLAPREISSRMNTFMLETKRPTRPGDRDSLVMHVVRWGALKSSLTES